MEILFHKSKIVNKPYNYYKDKKAEIKDAFKNKLEGNLKVWLREFKNELISDNKKIEEETQRYKSDNSLGLSHLTSNWGSIKAQNKYLLDIIDYELNKHGIYLEDNTQSENDRIIEKKKSLLTAQQRALAFYYILIHLGVKANSFDKTDIARLIRALSNSSDDYIYKKVKKIYSTKEEIRTEDYEAILPYFIDLGLENIVDQIREIINN